MKRSLIVPLIFFLALFIWIFVFCLLYTIGSNEVIYSLSLKNATPFFNSLLPSLFKAIPLSFVFAILSTFFYLMRHSVNLPISLAFILFCVFIGVFFIMPFSYKMYSKIEKNYNLIKENQIFSSNLIRKDARNIKYIWLDYDLTNNKVNPLILLKPTNDISEQQLIIEKNAKYDKENNYIKTSSKTSPILEKNDPLLMSHINIPSFLTKIIDNISLIFTDIQRAYFLSYFTYLLFAGILYLFVFSLFSLCFLSQWRLLNLLLSLTALRFFFSSWFFVSRSTKLDSFRLWFSNSLWAGFELPFIYGIVIILLLALGVFRVIKLTVGKTE